MTSAPVSLSSDAPSHSESVSWTPPDGDFTPKSNELVESFTTDIKEEVKAGEINGATKEIKQDGEAPPFSDRPKKNIDPDTFVTISEVEVETLGTSLETRIPRQKSAESNPTLPSGIDELCNSERQHMVFDFSSQTTFQSVVADEPSVDDSKLDALSSIKDGGTFDESNLSVSKTKGDRENGPTELYIKTFDLKSTAIVFDMTTTTDDSSESSVDIDLSESQHLSFDFVARPSTETSQINISLASDTLPLTITTGDCPQTSSTTVLQPVSNTPKRKHQEADSEKQPQSPKRQCQIKNDENARAANFTSAIGRHFSRAARSAGSRSAVGVSIRIVTSQVMRGNQLR